MRMKYTNEEKKILSDNMRSILAFLKSVNDTNREYITIPFGDFCESYEYTITIGPYGIYGSAGRASLDIDEEDISSKYPRDYHIFTNDTIGPDYMAKLCRDWKKVKSAILDRLEKQQNTIKSISNFEL